MGKQLALSFEAPARALTCAFGSPWINPGYRGKHHCKACAAAVESACRQFAADVAAGKYNARGYTPSEWKKRVA